MTSFADVMAAKTNSRRTTTHRVCFSTELEGKYYELIGELSDSIQHEENPKKSNSRSGDPRRRLGQVTHRPSQDVSADLAKLIEDNPTAFYEFQFEALPEPEWRALRRQHPPRDDDFLDRGGFNTDTFPRAVIRACMIDPQPTDEVFAWLDSKMSTGEWEQMTERVWNLNEGVRVAPKLPAASKAPAGSNAE